MALAERENVLSGPRGIFNIDAQSAAVEQRDERNGCRESAACVKAGIDRIAVLFESKNANVRVFDGQQPKKTTAEQRIPRSEQVAACLLGSKSWDDCVHSAGPFSSRFLSC